MHQQEPDQSCEPPGAGYFLSVDLSIDIRASLAEVYIQLLLVEKRSFFQLQPLLAYKPGDPMKSWY